MDSVVDLFVTGCSRLNCGDLALGSVFDLHHIRGKVIAVLSLI
jgi:hypothetical protein